MNFTPEEFIKYLSNRGQINLIEEINENLLKSNLLDYMIDIMKELNFSQEEINEYKKELVNIANKYLEKCIEKVKGEYNDNKFRKN